MGKTYPIERIREVLEMFDVTKENLLNIEILLDAPEQSFVERWIQNVEDYNDNLGKDKISQPHRECLRREAQLIESMVSTKTKAIKEEIRQEFLLEIMTARDLVLSSRSETN